MSNKRFRLPAKARGFVVVEVVTAVALAALMAAFAAKAIIDYRRAVACDQAHRAVLWAAAAQLQRYQAGAPLDSLPPAGSIAEDIAIETTQTDGQGTWAGFQQITVTARTTSLDRPVQACVSGYVPREVRP